MTLATLDLSLFTRGDQTQSEAFCKSFIEALKSQGFVKLINHDADEFFDLSEECKLKCEHPQRPNPHRGWSKLGKEKLAGITGFQKNVTNPPQVNDLKETFDQGNAKDDMFDNIWPDEQDIPGFRTFMEAFFEQCHLMHMQLLAATETGLALRTGRLVSLCNRNETELRLTRYPRVDIDRLRDGKTTRIAEHTDFGTFTLLFQDSTGGLEVEDQRRLGTFLPVTAEKEGKMEMIVNVGDTVQRWTNDELCSVNHRVTLPTALKDVKCGSSVVPARTSVAFFGKANRHASLRCFPEFSQHKAARFDEDVTAHEYNQRMVEKTY
ncbi:clavaminate synthase-like protein [Diplodia corticola]|uniref:Clavaminate synthase-like protein n=1 Tax=Diplodia corticola TaxID=236234 RepID=A0A1J9QZP8_9PEZI|nr:clavaminate synthase-like protein [Diplodia corticola]OJD33864.1 clavaminate synthase-like protein [Diplodia corticola]